MTKSLLNNLRSLSCVLIELLSTTVDVVEYSGIKSVCCSWKYFDKESLGALVDQLISPSSMESKRTPCPCRACSSSSSS